MRAIVHQCGETPALRYADLPDPVPGPGQVLLRIEASGVNPGDLCPRGPGAEPFIPGMEAVGVVEGLGSPDVHLRLGERVLVLAPQGCYADRMVVDARHAAPLPDFLASALAAALPINFCTAHLILTDLSPVEPGEFVLVLDAGSGAGSAAVQVAATLGGRVLAQVPSPRQAAMVQELGAELAVDAAALGAAVDSWTGGEGAGLILDGVGGDGGMRNLDLLATFGRVVLYGTSSGREPSYPPLRLLLRSQGLLGFNLASYLEERPEKAASSMSEVLNWAASGRVTPQIGREFPLSQAMEAQACLACPETLGKIVLLPALDAVLAQGRSGS